MRLTSLIFSNYLQIAGILASGRVNQFVNNLVQIWCWKHVFLCLEQELQELAYDLYKDSMANCFARSQHCSTDWTRLLQLAHKWWVFLFVCRLNWRKLQIWWVLGCRSGNSYDYFYGNWRIVKRKKIFHTHRKIHSRLSCRRATKWVDGMDVVGEL